MKYSLAERMKAWAEMFARREDLDFGTCPLRIGAANADVLSRYPDDAKQFASAMSSLNFSYRHKEDGDVSGFLYLSLEGIEEPAFLELPDGQEVPEDAMFALDCDGEGTGQASWYLLPEGAPAQIVYSVEDVVLFASLDEYLSAGARRGFTYQPRWQKKEDAGKYLAELSLPASTPPGDVKAKLVSRSMSPEMADDLIEWLGPDVTLILPR